MDAADVVGAGAPEPAGPPGLDSTPFASADDIVRAPGGVERLRQAMLQTSSNVGALQALLPQAVVVDLLGRATALLKAEPTLVELTPAAGTRVVVVGDTHGQFHDVCHMMDLVQMMPGGPAAAETQFVFNGDFVDRGSWGLEIVLLLAALKVSRPAAVYLVRGNHESSTCTKFYGFQGEVRAKYVGSGATAIYAGCKKLFAALPLAALVGGVTLVLHGGLFRHVPPPKKALGGAGAAVGGTKRKRRAPGGRAGQLQVGTLDDLRASSKGGMDPDGLGRTVLASDVLWSDPSSEPGLSVNDSRGIGLVFGPDVTQEFLSANGLRLVLRSHEGPDARQARADMGDVQDGYALDHDVPAGKLMTVFSAPDYPQFQDGPERYDNKAAVAVLTAPDWAAPQFLSYAAQPRPPIQAFYDFSAAGGDEEEDDEAAVATASEGGSVVATEDGDDCCEPSGADTASQVGGSELAGSGSAAAAGGEEDDEGEAGNSRQKRQARGSGTPKAPSSALPVIS